nr:reverse transcriptase domain-containing protein [Tanacetum cinerariifolium]
RGGPIAPIAIQAMNFGLKNDMIQQVQNSCQFHGLPGDDANKHLDKFLHVTQSIKVNGVTDDALRLYLFPHSLTHHATAWFDHLPRNSINTFKQMKKMFLGKYFPPSMVTKLRNEITNFCQRGTFMKRHPKEFYDLIENMTAHHNEWDTSAQQSESSSSITSLSDPKIVALKAEMAEINKNLMKVLQINHQVKAVTPSCETCGGPHFYNDCPATIGQAQNVYAAGAYQGGASHGQNLPPAYQALSYQAPVHQPSLPQSQVMTTTEFTNYMKANDAILKNMQTNMTSLTNSNLELKNMFGQFMKMNTASSLVSRTLPSNTITNPKEDLKGINTQSRIAYQRPTISTTSSSFPQVVERETKVTKYTVPPTNNGSTKDIQPMVVQIETSKSNYEPGVAPFIDPIVAPISAPKPNQKPSILYPSRLHDQKLRDKGNDQKEKFFQIFKDLDFNISFADALILMPKFGPTIKSMLTNKDKLYEPDRTLLNKHCSAVLLKKLPEKLGDSGKFLIPCDFLGMDKCLALADLGASINLMPLSVVAEDVFVKVGKFHFPADFVFVDFDTDPQVPLILGRSFLKTEKASIDVHEGELTLRVAKNDKSSIDEPPEVEIKDLPPHLKYAFLEGDDKLPVIIAKDLSVEERVALIKVLKSHKQAIAWKLSDIKGIDTEFCTHKILMEDDFEPAIQHQRRVNPKIHDVIKKEVLKLLDAGLIYPISDSPRVSPVHCVPKKGGFIVVENEENESIPTRLVTGWRVCIEYRKLNEATRKYHFPIPFMDQMLERLAGNEYYCFLDGFSGYFQIFIDLKDQEKTTFTCPYGMFVYRCMPFGLCNALGTFQRCMMAIFHYMIEKRWKSLWTTSRSLGIHLALVSPIWKRCYNCAVLGQRKTKHFQSIHYASKTMTDTQAHYTTMEKELLAVVYAFEKFWPYLVLSKSIVYTDHSALKYMFSKQDAKPRLLCWVLPRQEFDITVRDKKVVENLAVYHLSRLENPHQSLELLVLPLVIAVRTSAMTSAQRSCLTFKTPIGCTPYKLVYRKACHLPIELEHKAYWALKHASFDLQTTGDDRKVQLNELNELYDQAYENSLIYKEKTKRLHDSKIKDRVFDIGDRVLLFNSRLKIFSGKLKTRWSVSFTITQVFPYGTVELSQTDGLNFKVNGHRLKHYFGEDITKMVFLDLQTFPKDQ